MSTAKLYKLGLRIGADTVVAVQVSPFNLDQMRTKADAFVAELEKSPSPIPYWIMTLKSVLNDQDTQSHAEPFDVDTTEPDPNSSRYATSELARAAWLARYEALKANPTPYCYISKYDGNVRIDDAFFPPALQPTVTTTKTTPTSRERTGLGWIIGGLGAGAGLLFIVKKKRI